jgi:hypothetical protein
MTSRRSATCRTVPTRRFLEKVRGLSSPRPSDARGHVTEDEAAVAGRSRHGGRTRPGWVPLCARLGQANRAGIEQPALLEPFARGDAPAKPMALCKRMAMATTAYHISICSLYVTTDDEWWWRGASVRGKRHRDMSITYMRARRISSCSYR